MDAAPGFVWRDTGTLRIMAHGARAPSDPEWQAFVSSTLLEVNGKLVAPERQGAVIYSRGGMATPRQRRELKRLTLHAAPTLVLMTDSPVARGVATAIGWLVPALRDFRVFPLAGVDEAARALTPSPVGRAAFKLELASLLGQLDGHSPWAGPARWKTPDVGLDPPGRSRGGPVRR